MDFSTPQVVHGQMCLSFNSALKPSEGACATVPRQQVARAACKVVKHSCTDSASLDNCLHLVHGAVSKPLRDAGPRRQGLFLFMSAESSGRSGHSCIGRASQGRLSSSDHLQCLVSTSTVTFPLLVCASAAAVSTTWFGRSCSPSAGPAAPPWSGLGQLSRLSDLQAARPMVGAAPHMRPAMPGMGQAPGTMQHPGMQVRAISSALPASPCSWALM